MKKTGYFCFVLMTCQHLGFADTSVFSISVQPAPIFLQYPLHYSSQPQGFGITTQNQKSQALTINTTIAAQHLGQENSPFATDFPIIFIKPNAFDLSPYAKLYPNQFTLPGNTNETVGLYLKFPPQLPPATYYTMLEFNLKPTPIQAVKNTKKPRGISLDLTYVVNSHVMAYVNFGSPNEQGVGVSCSVHQGIVNINITNATAYVFSKSYQVYDLNGLKLSESRPASALPYSYVTRTISLPSNAFSLQTAFSNSPIQSLLPTDGALLNPTVQLTWANEYDGKPIHSFITCNPQ